MLGRSSLDLAIKILTKKCGVIPDSYVPYNGGFLFTAYDRNVKNKDGILNPYYLVDLKTKSAGPFSPAFDFNGFFKAVDNMTKIR